MRPHPKDFDDTFLAKNLIDESMLDVDAHRNRTLEIADEKLNYRGEAAEKRSRCRDSDQ